MPGDISEPRGLLDVQGRLGTGVSHSWQELGHRQMKNLSRAHSGKREAMEQLAGDSKPTVYLLPSCGCSKHHQSITPTFPAPP